MHTTGWATAPHNWLYKAIRSVRCATTYSTSRWSISWRKGGTIRYVFSVDGEKLYVLQTMGAKNITQMYDVLIDDSIMIYGTIILPYMVSPYLTLNPLPSRLKMSSFSLATIAHELKHALLSSLKLERPPLL